MKKPQAKRLTKKELELLKGLMRAWPSYQVKELAHLFHHISWLDLRVDELERIVTEYQQKDFFKKKEELGAPIPPQPLKDKQCSPLPMRLSLMAKEGQRGSEEWLRQLKWAHLTEEGASQIILEFEDRNYKS